MRFAVDLPSLAKPSLRRWHRRGRSSTMQSNHNGRGGLANNLTLQLSLLAAAVVLVLFLAAHYIW
jgi:hypothetical protein